MEESAIFDAVVDIVVGGDYDYYIYDLVPLGHALYYLSMASVYDQWIDKITALRTEMEEYAQVAAVMQRDKETKKIKSSKSCNISRRVLTLPPVSSPIN
jgi:arsenite-transporting ATPase